jgi:ABC-2 type transport system permease protein
MPMTFLSGVFYSIGFTARLLADSVSHLNPFFYMIDGFRYGFFGVSDVSPWLSLPLSDRLWPWSADRHAPAAHGYKIRG